MGQAAIRLSAQLSEAAAAKSTWEVDLSLKACVSTPRPVVEEAMDNSQMMALLQINMEVESGPL